MLIDNSTTSTVMVRCQKINDGNNSFKTVLHQENFSILGIPHYDSDPEGVWSFHIDNVKDKSIILPASWDEYHFPYLGYDTPSFRIFLDYDALKNRSYPTYMPKSNPVDLIFPICRTIEFYDFFKNEKIDDVKIIGSPDSILENCNNCHIKIYMMNEADMRNGEYPSSLSDFVNEAISCRVGESQRALARIMVEVISIGYGY